MASSEYDKMEKLSLDPDNMTNEELLQTSLEVLTKNVAPTLPGFSMVLIYCQWLDVHREHPSPLTQHWKITVQQWVQVLRSRGCSPSDIMLGLDEWNEITGDFYQKYSGPRPLPTDEDILRLCGTQSMQSYQPTGRVDHTGYGKGHDDFTGPPPGSYICIRCGVPGHHLQVCPTNLDPAYDRPPGNTYICAVCHKKGAHYRSLCPHNADPLSITQQRRMAFITASYNCNIAIADAGQKIYGGYFQNGRPRCVSPQPIYHSDSSKEHEENKMCQARGAAIRAGLVEEAPNADNRDFHNRKRGRKLSSSTPSRSSNEGSPTPDKRQSLRKRMRRIEVYQDKLAKGKELASTQIEMIQKKAVIEKELSALDENNTRTMDKEYGEDGQLNSCLHRSSISGQGSGLDSLNKKSVNQPSSSSGSMRVATSNEFIQKLMECQQDEMNAVVNTIKPRPTALDKWELLEHDKRSLLHMAPRGVDISSDPFLDDDTIFRTLRTMSDAEYSKMLDLNFDLSGPTMYVNPPFNGARHAHAKVNRNCLMVKDEQTTGRLTQYRVPLEQPARGLQAPKEDVLPKAFDKVIAPPKRVPKDITNLPN